MAQAVRRARAPVWMGDIAWLAAGGLAALLLLWRTALPAARAHSYAFSAYYTAARLTLQGQAGVQFCDEWFFTQERALGFGDRADFFCPNPPTTALLLLPVAWLPPQIARAAWVAIELAMAVAIVAIGWRIVQAAPRNDTPAHIPQPAPWFGASRARFAALAALVLLLFKPLHADLQTNQVYTLLALLYALWLYGYLTHNDRLCGAALAALALAKLAGWPLWLLMLAAQRWRALAWAIGLGLGALLLSLPLFGLDFWRLYLLSQLPAIPSTAAQATTANQTLIGLLRQCFAYNPQWSPAPLLDAPWLASGLWWVLALALLAPTLLAVRACGEEGAKHDHQALQNSWPRSLEQPAPLAMLCLVIPLQPAGEEYHYTLLLILVLVALCCWRPTAASALVLLAAIGLFALPAYFVDAGSFAGWPRALLAYPRMYAALLLWLFLLLNKHSSGVPAANLVQ